MGTHDIYQEIPCDDCNGLGKINEKRLGMISKQTTRSKTDANAITELLSVRISVTVLFVAALIYVIYLAIGGIAVKSQADALTECYQKASAQGAPMTPEKIEEACAHLLKKAPPVD